MYACLKTGYLEHMAKASTHTEVAFNNFEKRLKKEIDGLLSMESRL